MFRSIPRPSGYCQGDFRDFLKEAVDPRSRVEVGVVSAEKDRRVVYRV
jgi:hypothetical protein